MRSDPGCRFRRPRPTETAAAGTHATARRTRRECRAPRAGSARTPAGNATWTRAACLCLATLFLVLPPSAAVSAATTVADVLASDPDLATFRELDRLIDGGSFLNSTDLVVTAFVPNNAAFNGMDRAVLDRLLRNDEWHGHRLNLVDYHLVRSAYPSSGLTDGLVLFPLNGEELAFSVSQSSIRVSNGDALILQRDIHANASIVHVIDAVLTPFWTVAGMARAAILFPGTHTLASWMQLSDVDSFLQQSETPHTFFAPVNIDEYLVANPRLAALFQADPLYLADFLRLHIAVDNWYKSELLRVDRIETLGGTVVTVQSRTDEDIVKFRIGHADWIQESFVNDGLFVPVTDVLPLPTVMDRIHTQPDIAAFATLIASVGLQGLLTTSTELTVLAPTVDALQRISPTFLAQLQSSDFQYHLRDLVAFHIVTDNLIRTTDIVDAGPLQVSALNNDVLLLSTDPPASSAAGGHQDSAAIYVNADSQISRADIRAFNPGIVHAIDTVLKPVWFNRNVLDVAQESTTLSDFAQQLATANADLSGPGPFTVFAVPDVVLNGSALTGTGTAAAVTTTIEYYIVPAMYVAEQIGASVRVEALSGQSLTIFNAGEGTIVVNGEVSVTTSMLARNGVVHVLSGVLVALPPTVDPPDGVEVSPPTVVDSGSDATAAPMAEEREALGPTATPTFSGDETPKAVDSKDGGADSSRASHNRSTAFRSGVLLSVSSFLLWLLVVV